MTKKDYKVIAEVLKNGWGKSYGQIVQNMADALKQENDRFDYDKFYQACRRTV